MQYKIGDKVAVTGQEWAIEPFSKGDVATITATSGEGFMWVEGDNGKATQIRPCDCRPFESIGGGVDELRERHKDRVPTYSEGSEGASVYPSYGQFPHTEQNF